MGLPDIFIEFQTAAVTAITRSARGVVALVRKGTDGPVAVFTSLAEVDEAAYGPEDYQLLRLAFRAGPNKVIAVPQGETAQETFAKLRELRFDWLAAPGLDAEAVAGFVRELRAGGRGVKAVVANAVAPDCEGIVNFCAGGLETAEGKVEAADYTARIAGLLAATPLTRSATYAPLAELTACAPVDDPDGAVDAGKLIVTSGWDGYRLGRAVNSLTTLTVDKAAPFQKIKIVEGVDLIRTDISRTFESGYIGKVLNDYDNKLLLVTAINAYFKGLMGDVLDKTAENACAVSLKGQRGYLEARGTDTADMDQQEILRANTGSEVFLEAHLTFCDAMEDLSLLISM